MAGHVGFGGGCHWCTEAVFTAVSGVTRVEQGYIRSDEPDDSFSEAVAITFEPAVIALERLIDIHLQTHSSTSAHRMRGKYRSAVYAYDAEQAAAARDCIDQLQRGFAAPIVTRVLPFRGFRASDGKFHRYSEKHADGPFCRRYVDPKIDILRENFGSHLRNG